MQSKPRFKNSHKNHEFFPDLQVFISFEEKNRPLVQSLLKRKSIVNSLQQADTKFFQLHFGTLDILYKQGLNAWVVDTLMGKRGSIEALTELQSGDLLILSPGSPIFAKYETLQFHSLSTKQGKRIGNQLFGFPVEKTPENINPKKWSSWFQTDQPAEVAVIRPVYSQPLVVH